MGFFPPGSSFGLDSDPDAAVPFRRRTAPSTPQRVFLKEDPFLLRRPLPVTPDSRFGRSFQEAEQLDPGIKTPAGSVCPTRS